MRWTPVATALVLVALTQVSAGAAAADPPQASPSVGALKEVLVDVPREHSIKLEVAHEKASIFSVESHNEPKDADLKEAEEKDPTDKTVVLLRFYYRNDGYVKHRVSLQAFLLGPSGEVFGEGGRRSSLDPQKKEDTVTFPMKVRTLDWPKASKLRILATFLD